MKRTKAYQAYRERYYIEKKRGNIHKSTRLFSEKQFKNFLKIRDQKTGKLKYTPAKILKRQMYITSKRVERITWKNYLKLRKKIDRGERVTVSDSFIGLSKTPVAGLGISEEEARAKQEESSLGYHYNISGLLKDNYVLHDIIAFRIDQGEEQKEVLADYGY